MRVDFATAEGRRAAEARMTSRANIWRTTGRTTQNEETGEEVPEWEIVHAAIPFRLGGSDRGGSGTRTINVGGVEMQVAVRVGHFPAATEDLLDGDYIEVVSGENAGVALRIVEAAWQDQATARRVPVVSVDRPEEW